MDHGTCRVVAAECSMSTLQVVKSGWREYSLLPPSPRFASHFPQLHGPLCFIPASAGKPRARCSPEPVQASTNDEAHPAGLGDVHRDAVGGDRHVR